MDKKRDFIESFGKYTILMLLISFLAWIMETLVVSIPRGRFYDRGFLTLPFCTIYGFALLVIFFLFGTPDEGGKLFGKIRGKSLRYPLYFLCAALLVTTFELCTGLFFEWAFGIELWTYAHRPLNFMGYISLDYSVMWGFCITLIMKFIFPVLKKLVFGMSRRLSDIVAALLIGAVSTDFCILIVKMIF